MVSSIAEVIGIHLRDSYKSENKITPQAKSKLEHFFLVKLGHNEL